MYRAHLHEEREVTRRNNIGDLCDLPNRYHLDCVVVVELYCCSRLSGCATTTNLGQREAEEFFRRDNCVQICMSSTELATGNRFRVFIEFNNKKKLTIAIKSSAIWIVKSSHFHTHEKNRSKVGMNLTSIQSLLFSYISFHAFETTQFSNVVGWNLCATMKFNHENRHDETHERDLNWAWEETFKVQCWLIFFNFFYFFILFILSQHFALQFSYSRELTESLGIFLHINHVNIFSHFHYQPVIGASLIAPYRSNEKRSAHNTVWIIRVPWRSSFDVSISWSTSEVRTCTPLARSRDR